MKSKILFFITILLFLSSCTMVNHSVSTPIIYLSDLNVSDEVWGQAKSTKVLGIDFQRLLKRNIESANVGLSTTSIPINVEAIPININAATRVFFLPTLSPKCPKRIPPIGLAIKPAAKVNKDNISAVD